MDKHSEGVPEELARRGVGLKKIREAKTALEEEARAPSASRRQRRSGGEHPEREKAQRNLPDPESKMQEEDSRRIHPGLQRSGGRQFAVPRSSSRSTSPLPPAMPTNSSRPLCSIQRILRRKPRAVLADAGYWSESNAQAMEKKNIDPFIATKRLKRGDIVTPAPRGRPPGNLSARQKMERKLATLRGKKTYAKRNRSSNLSSVRSSKLATDSAVPATRTDRGPAGMGSGLHRAQSPEASRGPGMNHQREKTTSPGDAIFCRFLRIGSL